MKTEKLNDSMLTTTTGGTTSDLKSRFSAGSIPLDTDFSELIDIAECGRRAIGQSADQSDNSVGVGLALSSDSASIGKLSVLAGTCVSVGSSGVNVNLGNGLTNNNNTVAVKAKSGGSLLVDSSGVSIDPGDCLELRDNGIGIKCGNGVTGSNDYLTVKAGSNITVDGNGVSVNIGNGLESDSNAIAVRANSSKGIIVDSSGVSVKVKTNSASGLTVNSDGITVVAGACIGLSSAGVDVNIGNGLTNSSDKLAVKAGSNITVDGNGVSVNIDSLVNAIVNKIIPPGTIVPLYNSSTLPDGWVWCDGNNGTPNLNSPSGNYTNINVISGHNSADFVQKQWTLDITSADDDLIFTASFIQYIMKL